jgi:hypothetical protein
MKVGVTGHQAREGIEWSWVERIVRAELIKLGRIDKAFSSLAAGTDQLFAKAALHLSIPVTAVIPIEHYEQFFEGEALANYFRLLALCDQLALKGPVDDPDKAFFAAGTFVADSCDLLFAVWDGQPAEGFGGTADIVDYARRVHRRVLHINPITQAVIEI